MNRRALPRLATGLLLGALACTAADSPAGEESRLEEGQTVTLSSAPARAKVRGVVTALVDNNVSVTVQEETPARTPSRVGKVASFSRPTVRPGQPDKAAAALADLRRFDQVELTGSVLLAEKEYDTYGATSLKLVKRGPGTQPLKFSGTVIAVESIPRYDLKGGLRVRIDAPPEGAEHLKNLEVTLAWPRRGAVPPGKTGPDPEEKDPSEALFDVFAGDVLGLEVRAAAGDYVPTVTAVRKAADGRAKEGDVVRLADGAPDFTVRGPVVAFTVYKDEKPGPCIVVQPLESVQGKPRPADRRMAVRYWPGEGQSGPHALDRLRLLDCVEVTGTITKDNYREVEKYLSVKLLKHRPQSLALLGKLTKDAAYAIVPNKDFDCWQRVEIVVDRPSDGAAYLKGCTLGLMWEGGIRTSPEKLEPLPPEGGPVKGASQLRMGDTVEFDVRIARDNASARFMGHALEACVIASARKVGEADMEELWRKAKPPALCREVADAFKPGDVVQLVNLANGTCSGRVSRCQTGERDPGIRLAEVVLVQGQKLPEPCLVALPALERPEDKAKLESLRNLYPGDRVELSWHYDAARKPCLSVLQVKQLVPRTGQLEGKVAGWPSDRGIIHVRATKAPPGREAPGEVMVQLPWIKNPRKDINQPWIPAAEGIKPDAEVGFSYRLGYLGDEPALVAQRMDRVLEPEVKPPPPPPPPPKPPRPPDDEF